MTTQDYALERAVLTHLLGPWWEGTTPPRRGVIDPSADSRERIVRQGRFYNPEWADPEPRVIYLAYQGGTEGWIIRADGKWFWPPRPFDELVEMLRDPAFRERVGLFSLP